MRAALASVSVLLIGLAVAAEPPGGPPLVVKPDAF